MSLAFSPDQGANTAGDQQIYPVFQQNYPGGPGPMVQPWSMKQLFMGI